MGKSAYEDDWFGYGGDATGKGYGGAGASQWKRCYHDHPPLKIGDWTVYGGSCSSPVVGDADLYIGFDYGMTFRAKPWKGGHVCQEIAYPVTDRRAPSDAADFKQMVKWVAEQVKTGKKVHAGCIGGHGRTGTFLAALVSVLDPTIEDPIEYVRKNYCEKAVESGDQVGFLVKHFGCKTAKVVPFGGYKTSTSGKGSKNDPLGYDNWPYSGGIGSSGSSKKAKKAEVTSQLFPLESSKKSIWKGS